MHVNDKASSYYKEKSRETVKHHGRTIQYVNIVQVRNETIKSYNDVLQCDTTETGLQTDFKYTSMYSDLLSCKTMHCSHEQSLHDTVKCAKTDNVSIGKERVALNLNRTSISQNCHQDTLESSASQTLNLNQLIHQLQDDEHFIFQICTEFVGINIVMIKDKSVALNDEWNYHCLECKECFYDEADLIRHDCMKRKSNHSKDYICRCADCKNLCKSASSSKQMQKISQTDFDIKCMSCLRKISEETMLEHVNMNHCNQGIYSNICKIHVQNKHRFRQRFVSNHKSYKCKKCDKYKQRMEHVRCKHTEHTKLCHVCGKMFYKHNGAFKLHLQSHDFDRPRCDHCQRTFTQRSTLRIHMTLHFGGPKFECKTCKKLFTQFQNLKCHEKKVHTADRPYRCEKCGFGAVRMSELRKHMFRHSRIKQFQCANCETTFRWRTNLSAHIRNGVCKKTL